LQVVIRTKMFRMQFLKTLTNASHPPVYTYRWALIIIIIINWYEHVPKSVETSRGCKVTIL
jgi:hypothetical protein